MRVPLNGPAYRLSALQMSCQRAVNLYLEVPEKPSKTPSMLRPTPGLLRRATLGDGPVRGAIVAGGFLWVVSGAAVYRVSPTFGTQQIGVVSTQAGAVSMASNGLQVLMVDGSFGYVLTLATQKVELVTDPDFPLGVTSCTFIDNFFVVTGNGTGQFYWSDLLDGSTWNGLDFASAEGAPDNAVACIADHRELWIFGENTTEVYLNTGDAALPFERAGNAFIEHGCASPWSVAKLDNTVFWLGADDRGEGTIWRAAGYSPQRISTYAIERAIASYGSISDAVAYTYQDQGHDFYVINFPTGETTWCYDAAVGEWHERCWRDPLSGALNRHRGQVQAFFGRRQVLGDWQDGRLYTLEHDVATDDGATILRLRSTQAASDLDAMNRVFYGRFEVDLEKGQGNTVDPGADPIMLLRYSNDGGYTWSNPREARMGRAGEYRTRCKWERCGSARSRVWEVSWTDPVVAALFGAVAHTEVGHA